MGMDHPASQNDTDNKFYQIRNKETIICFFSGPIPSLGIPQTNSTRWFQLLTHYFARFQWVP